VGAGLEFVGHEVGWTACSEMEPVPPKRRGRRVFSRPGRM
jgi:hypothetical protein